VALTINSYHPGTVPELTATTTVIFISPRKEAIPVSPTIREIDCGLDVRGSESLETIVKFLSDAPCTVSVTVDLLPLLNSKFPLTGRRETDECEAKWRFVMERLFVFDPRSIIVEVP
jgi:hypothetical protein